MIETNRNGLVSSTHLSLALALVSVVPILPTTAAKPVAIVGMTYLAALLSIHVTYKKKAALSILILSCALLPGALQAIVISPGDVLRFAPIFFVILFYMSTARHFDYGRLKILFSLSIIYLVFTQVLLALGVSFSIEIRDHLYPRAENPWDYGSIDQISLEYREFRAGGIFYNPNVLGLVLLLYGYCYVYCSLLKRTKLIIEHSCYKLKRLSFSMGDYTVLMISTFGGYLTGSRTVLLGFSVLFLFVFFIRILLLSRSSKTIYFYGLILVTIGLTIIFIIFQDAFLTSDGSVWIKFFILKDYLENSSFSRILFGGEFYTQFDSELGYWIGAAGVPGALCIFLFITSIGIRYIMFAPITVMYISSSIGNSVFYGLLTGILAMTVCMFGIHYLGVIYKINQLQTCVRKSNCSKYC